MLKLCSISIEFRLHSIYFTLTLFSRKYLVINRFRIWFKVTFFSLRDRSDFGAGNAVTASKRQQEQSQNGWRPYRRRITRNETRRSDFISVLFISDPFFIHSNYYICDNKAVVCSNLERDFCGIL